MSFRITGLPATLFHPLFGLPNAQLAARGAKRYTVDAMIGYPDRIELRDAAIGETVLLLNYTHQPADTPFRASHAIFVIEGATTQFDRIDDVPDVLRRRTISLRAFDAAHMLVGADLGDGSDLASMIAPMLAQPEISYLHAHYAKPGCYAARIERA